MATVKFTANMSIKDFDAGIKSHANRGKKFDADVQKAAMSLLARMRKAQKDGVEIKGDNEELHAALVALEVALKPKAVCEEGEALL